MRLVLAPTASRPTARTSPHATADIEFGNQEPLPESVMPVEVCVPVTLYVRATELPSY